MPRELRSIVSLSGVEKVAAFLIAIGVEKSAPLLKEFDEFELERITVEIARLKNLPSQIATGIIFSYYEMMMADKFVTQGGIDYAQEMLQSAFGLQVANDLIKKVKAATEVTGFKLLQTLQPSDLLNYLQKEHPQTIALILANMKYSQAAGIISELHGELQGEVAYRLATMGKTSPELLQEIEEALTTQMGGTFGSKLSTSGGVKALAEIMNSTSRTVESSIMETLVQKDPELATELKNLMFVFEDVLRLRDLDIQKIVKGVDSKSLALALKVSSEDLQERVFANLSRGAVEALKEEMEYLGAVRLREVEEAQVGIVEHIRDLENRGEVVLSRSQEEEFVE